MSPAWQRSKLRRCTGLSECLSLCCSARSWNAGMSWSGLAIRNCLLPATPLLVEGWWSFKASKTIPVTDTSCHSPGQGPMGLAGMLCALCIPETFPFRWYLCPQHLYKTPVMTFERKSGREKSDLPEETYGKRERLEARSPDSHIYHSKSQFILSFSSIKQCNRQNFALPIHFSFRSQPPPW